MLVTILDISITERFGIIIIDYLRIHLRRSSTLKARIVFICRVVRFQFVRTF